MPENGADVNHLNVVHVPTMFAGPKLTNKWPSYWQIAMKHVWEGRWNACEEKGKKHVAIINVAHHLQLFNITLPFLVVHVKAVQVCLK